MKIIDMTEHDDGSLTIGADLTQDELIELAQEALRARITKAACAGSGEAAHKGDLAFRLRLYAQQFEDQHAPQNITMALREAAAEIEGLRAKVETWINHTKTAVWSDSEECKFLTAENDRLRAALSAFACDCGPGSDEPCPKPENCRNYIARAALEGK